jgi:hypothetical protein
MVLRIVAILAAMMLLTGCSTICEMAGGRWQPERCDGFNIGVSVPL